MADRGRGRSSGTGRGGRPTGTTGGTSHSKAAILDLAKYVDQELRVKFAGGREVSGTLKGYDQLLNLVMDNVEEHFEDGGTRSLGLVVLRGTALTVINPADGFDTISNPFAQA